MLLLLSRGLDPKCLQTQTLCPGPLTPARLSPLPQICSLMRGGIAERGGIRVGHRIIEINGQSVVATPHEKIISILTNAVGEVGGGSR